jgi:hypothetical protein
MFDPADDLDGIPSSGRSARGAYAIFRRIRRPHKGILPRPMFLKILSGLEKRPIGASSAGRDVFS